MFSGHGAVVFIHVYADESGLSFGRKSIEQDGAAARAGPGQGATAQAQAARFYQHGVALRSRARAQMVKENLETVGAAPEPWHKVGFKIHRTTSFGARREKSI